MKIHGFLKWVEIAAFVTFARITNGQYYPGYYSRTYGVAPPSHYDYYRHKHVPYQQHPSNYLIPYPKPSKPHFGKEYVFNGPPLPPFQRPEAPPSSPPQGNTPNSTSSPANRDNRFLSIFTVVQFPKDTCTTSSGDSGTCMSPPDCLQRGGLPTTPCANNFGICCVFMASCGQTVSQNGTYFINKGFPAGYNGTGSCQLTINKMHPDICQYRLDFDQFSITGPEPENHICNYDHFIVSGTNPVPGICGFNTGNHMYVDAGLGHVGPVLLTMITNGPEFSRNWKIKITQIPCNSNFRAEDGCLQYFTGIAGTIKSFNYEPAIGLHLSNQDYSICIRAERNFCGIQYTQCIDAVNNRTHSFSLTGNTVGQNSVASSVGSVGGNACNMDWLIIPCVSNVGKLNNGQSTCVDRLCGGTMNADISTIPATIYSSVKPFRLFFHTNNVELPHDMGNRGFCLNYVQQPCGNNVSP
ncbi:uncharacterized protein LOC135844112 [Planococcus citri]|uniref:uncharacterized protein LOC135844112 n=1 Tax=Planococcus citri TaxID=170843 RepID=UPI0031F9506F